MPIKWQVACLGSRSAVLGDKHDVYDNGATAFLKPPHRSLPHRIFISATFLLEIVEVTGKK